MKKFSLILASLVLFAGATFANPVKKQDDKSKAKTTKTDKKAKTEKKADKKADKKSDKK